MVIYKQPNKLKGGNKMNVNALKGEIKRNGLTIAQTAKKIGISESTMSRKLKEGSFGLTEANALIGLLGIEHPENIFFDNKTT